MQSEPVGPWWERSPGVAVDALLSANDGTGRVAGAGEYYHYSNLGFALLGEAVARLRGAPWWDVVAAELLRAAGHDAHVVPPGGAARPGSQRRALHRRARRRAPPGHPRDGAGRAGLEHGHRPAPVGRLPGHRSPRRPGTGDPGRDGDGPATGPGYGLGPAADRRRRPPPDRAHRLDAGLPGQPVRRPLDARRLRRADQRHHRARHGVGAEDAARRRRARPGRAVDAERRRTRRRSPACRACGSGATPPSSSAGTAARLC